MKKAVLFDFDYTLGDSSAGIISSVQYALSQMGVPPADPSAIRTTIGLSLADTYTALTGSAAAAETHCFAHYFKENADRVMVQNTTLYPQIPDMLERLHANGVKIGIVTTKYHIRIEQIFTVNNLLYLIDGIVGADDVSQPKPAPEGILKIGQLFHLDLSDMLYVGDSLIDAKAAQAAGVDFIAVLTGTTPADAFADYPCIGILPAAAALDL